MTAHSAKYREVNRVLVVTLVLNVAVAVAKLVIGYLTFALAMVADGYHSLLDGSSNVLGLIAIHFASKPPDEDHQYGHHKYETISAMAISVALFAAAYRILQEAWERLAEPVVPEIGALNFVVMAVTLVVNIGVARYEQREGERLASPFLISDAAHTRSDVFATSAVLISLVAAHFGVYAFDTVASIFIAGVIVRIGYRIIRDNLSVISDAIAVDPETVRGVVLAIEGVTDCDRIRTRGTTDHVFMDLNCYVSGEMTMSAAHDLADRIEAAIHARLPTVKDIVVHLEPDEKAPRHARTGPAGAAS